MDASGLIHVDKSYYIIATRTPGNQSSLVLKQGDSFAVVDGFGDFDPQAGGEFGLYHDGTRHLSRMVLTIANGRPLLLSSTVSADNAAVTADLTNPDIYLAGTVVLARGTIHIHRSKFLFDATCYEEIRVRNFDSRRVSLTLTLDFDSDFADIFEVRGQDRPARGEMLDPRADRGALVLSYRGLDRIVRRTTIRCEPEPHAIVGREIELPARLLPQEEVRIQVRISCENEQGRSAVLSRPDSWRRARDSRLSTGWSECEVSTSNQQFNSWLDRSAADLRMMISATPFGPYPYAGVPWFSTPFGRDGMIAALECLWVAPGVARGVLSYLAGTQAVESSTRQDAEPGKILHESRKGEMANLGEVPFQRYYGSVDSTPLFLMLAARYLERSGDTAFIASLRPNLRLALQWLDRYGDSDGDGFVEYSRRSSEGLLQQGWKDSQDSVFHEDGTLAEGPIALCEVQGYVWAARQGAAAIARALGEEDEARRLERSSEELRERFESRFWCEDLGTYALALDGAKRPCRVRGSNPGHCLYSGIAGEERARRVTCQLVSGEFFSGWGIRTLARGECRYNPMSYHNGSIWPHDNAIIAAGMSRYGHKRQALDVLSAMFDVSVRVSLQRLPELFCGFDRREGEGPTLYPVACSPQAWAAGAVFLLLQACLGISIDAARRRVTFHKPVLPESVQELRVRGLQLGGSRADIRLHRHGEAVAVAVDRREGEIEIVSHN